MFIVLYSFAGGLAGWRFWSQSEILNAVCWCLDWLCGLTVCWIADQGSLLAEWLIFLRPITQRDWVGTHTHCEQRHKDWSGELNGRWWRPHGKLKRLTMSRSWARVQILTGDEKSEDRCAWLHDYSCYSLWPLIIDWINCHLHFESARFEPGLLFHFVPFENYYIHIGFWNRINFA